MTCPTEWRKRACGPGSFPQARSRPVRQRQNLKDSRPQRACQQFTQQAMRQDVILGLVRLPETGGTLAFVRRQAGVKTSVQPVRSLKSADAWLSIGESK